MNNHSQYIYGAWELQIPCRLQRKHHCIHYAIAIAARRYFNDLHNKTPAFPPNEQQFSLQEKDEPADTYYYSLLTLTVKVDNKTRQRSNRRLLHRLSITIYNFLCHRLLPRRYWEPQRKSRALSTFRSHFNLGMMHIGNPFGNR
jgi:hypothetical protein